MGGNMSKLIVRAANICGILFSCCLYINPLKSFAQQQLNLGPLPGVGQVPEYLVPGNGQGFAGLATFYMNQPVILFPSYSKSETYVVKLLENKLANLKVSI